MGTIAAHNPLLSPEDHREYETRIGRLREILAREGLDGVIVSDRRYRPENPTVAETPAYARYLSNLTLYGGGGGGAHWANRSNPIVVVSRDRDPVMVLPPGLRNTWVHYARHRSWIVNTKCAGENRVFASQGDFPSNSGVIELADVVSAIREAGLSEGRIGVAGNWPNMQATYEAFPAARFTPIVQTSADGQSRDILKSLIGSNSEWEIIRLERAQGAANAAVAALREAAKSGASVREAGVAAKTAGLRAGAHEISVDGSVIAEPWTFAWYDTAPDHLRFEPGKLYTIEIAYCMVDACCVQTCRLFTVGEPEPEARRMHEAALNSMHAMLGALKVGVTGADMWDAGIAPLEAAGYAPWCRLGHASGFELMGPQGLQFFPGDRYAVRPNQAVMVHGPVVDATGQKVGIIGDTVLALEGGWRHLADPAPFEL